MSRYISREKTFSNADTSSQSALDRIRLYRSQQSQYSEMATKQNLIKVSMFTTRKEGVSEAEFHRYWTESHSKVVSEWLQRNGVVRYSQVSAMVHKRSALRQQVSDYYPQFHTPSWSRNKAKENISVLPDAAYLLYDGVVEMLMQDEKCFQSAIEGMPFAAVNREPLPWCHQLTAG